MDVILGEKDKRDDDLIEINCFDRAIHGLTEKKQLNITSYSRTVVSTASIEMGLTPASTSVILTWKQVAEKEKMSSNSVPSVTDMYAWLGESFNNDMALISGGNV